MRHRLNRIARPTNFIHSDPPDQSSEAQRSLTLAFTSGWRLKLCTRGGIKHDRGARNCLPPAKPVQRLLDRALTKSVILKPKAKKRAINICLPRMCHACATSYLVLRLALRLDLTGRQMAGPAKEVGAAKTFNCRSCRYLHPALLPDRHLANHEIQMALQTGFLSVRGVGNCGRQPFFGFVPLSGFSIRGR